MNRPVVSAPESLFPRPMLTCAAVFYALAAVPGLAGLIALFLPGGFQALMEDLYQGGTASGDALITWSVYHSILIALNFGCCALIAWGLAVDLWKKPGRGMSLLRKAAQGLLYGLQGGGAVLGVLFVYRFIRFLWINLPQDTGLYIIYPMVISEGLMVSLAYGVFLLLKRFLDACVRSAASISYTRYSGKLDDVSIPGFAATGFLILGILGLIAVPERCGTLTIVWALQPYYQLVLSREPVLLLSSLLYLFASLGHLVMYAFLRRYKRETERLLFQNRTRII